MDEAAARTRLAVLARAQGDVTLGRFGAAAVVTPELSAFEELSAAPSALRALRAQLEELARAGAGARRVYAALLLRSIDADAGRAALEAMRGSDEPCGLFPGGCARVSAWLGETAMYLLGQPMTDPRREAALRAAFPPPRERQKDPWPLRFLDWLMSRV